LQWIGGMVYEPEMVRLLSAFSFMIYVMHAPLVAYATEAVFALVNQVPYYAC